MTRSDAIAAAMMIDGWLTEGEAGALYDAAYNATGPIVEIGSWQGRSTTVLALGSMAGSQQQVYAVDSFDGVPPSDRPSAFGVCPGWKSSTPELLRANLAKSGINGIVTIVPRASRDAVAEIPECGVLFVDGDHDYASVSLDFKLYLPKVKLGGCLIAHDVCAADPGVVLAFDEQVMGNPAHWRVRRRVDSAMVAQRQDTERRKVVLGLPGGSFCWGAMIGVTQASLGAHDVTLSNNGNGWDDFNAIWARALNAFEAGLITHFAMLHSDVAPEPGWLDLLIGEMEDRQADMISVAIPLKDTRGVTSCGVGDLEHPWVAFRRFTMRELMTMPETFGIADTPHPDKVLLHNTGCFVLDLRNPLFRKTREDGQLYCSFDFPTGVVRSQEGPWVNLRESEDWYFSRQMHVLGAKSFITRKVKLSHHGMASFPNSSGWGSYKNGDEDTAKSWRKDEK